MCSDDFDSWLDSIFFDFDFFNFDPESREEVRVDERFIGVSGLSSGMTGFEAGIDCECCAFCELLARALKRFVSEHEIWNRKRVRARTVWRRPLWMTVTWDQVMIANLK